MSDRTFRLLVGAAGAAAAAVVTYLLGQGIVTVEVATAVNAIIAGVAGYLAPKATP